MTEPTEPIVSGRDRSLDQLPETNERRTKRLPSRRLRQVVAMVGGLIDGWLVHNTGAPAVKTILSALFMAAFLLWGLNLIHKLRLKDRPVLLPPSERDPSLPPPKGGWANPSGSQKWQRRISKLWADIRRSRSRR